MKHRHYFVIAFLLSPFILSAQGIDSLYRLADNYAEVFTSKYYYGAENVRAGKRAYLFAYETQTPDGRECYIIDPITATQKKAFDRERMSVSLSEFLNREVDPNNLPIRRIRPEKDSLFFTIDNVDHFITLSDYKITKCQEQNDYSRPYWGLINKENEKVNVPSPDGKKEAYISEGNLWVKDIETGERKKLSNDGSPYEYYSSNIYWSPDSRKIVCSKYSPVEFRKLLLISSSPTTQLQPVTEEYEYPKPGDALPVRRPTLFMVETGEIVLFNIPNIEQQYYLGNIRWNKESDFFTFDFNKRGHQQYIIYAGNLSGELRTVVNEECNTFIYYYSLYQHWLEDSNEMLWISERDGWRHIYLYNVLSGKVKKQLTKGEWVVKEVVKVDEKKRQILFIGCGMDKDEDPYLEKYYSLNIDNGKIVALTPENAHHSVTFSHDYAYMFDSYSRVDLPPTLVVRSVEEGGKVIYKPDLQPDISAVKAVGWQQPEVFSAKGRDGKTDIWGMIVRPSNFDSSKKYPVIEYIYAGPHDSHVPKRFAIEHRYTSAIAELGFIFVMIDGMGTANRSKAFHDVCWKNLKDAGFPDRIAWIKAAAAKYPEMNIDNMGIYGMSAGGQSTMGALLFYPEFYKVGVSSCACHDNRMDKIWWNEQWMGYPIGEHYSESSNMENAHLLQGKLMLILGELDNNVDPSSTLQVVNELVKHDKDFEFVMLPGERHTMGGKYGERKRRDFFVKHILKIEPPQWDNNNNQ
ncbi:MAG: DPP IV N-terminal domain-containing protein [Salinivirgaceae bacterium]|jgi:dipeptidyl aminopeptidase/acylaminoacyl peptidase|nr:prolyl oligopeptidase family serine peptidase [Bacteroidales bacterium]HQA87005.1 DPP IV N-terminal domain-containing protein [Bacteroidales bacterium]